MLFLRNIAFHRGTRFLLAFLVFSILLFLLLSRRLHYDAIVEHLPYANRGTKGKWEPQIPVPLVPAAAAVLPHTGHVVLWAADRGDVFGAEEGDPGRTMTAVFDPLTGQVSPLELMTTDHNMFCPGLSMSATGSVIVSGGSTAEHTSIYEAVEDRWQAGPSMVMGRGYHAQATLSDGRTFTVGGSWSGQQGGKFGEVLDSKASAWSALPGCPSEPLKTDDVRGDFTADNHAWLFAWANASVFQAGPSKAMNWYGTRGQGSQRPAGNRAADGDSMNGNAVMYDASQGKILTLGGASSYTEAPATRAAHIITLRGRDGDGEGHVPETAVNVEAVEPMHYARAFANSVVLPNGDVFTNGGVTWAKQWTDINASQIPEMWHPQTRRFSRLAASPIPRSYHSFALLLPDARVLVGGGGLCWEACEDPSANHLDVQVYNPPYLYRGGAWSGAAAASPRPEILSLSSSVAAPGDEFTIVTDGPVADVALIRYGSSTHPINTDQRRIPLWPGPGKQQQEGNRWNYTVELPRDGGVLIPGYWMVFVLDGRGVPSISARLMVSVAE